MKTNITIIALSLAVACAASTSLAQRSGQTDAANDSISGAYFQEVAIDGVGELAPGDYIQPAFSGGACYGGCSAGACSTGGCDAGCGGGCCDTGCSSCCRSPFAHRNSLFADFLYLRPRDAEVAFAVPGTFAVLGPAGTVATPVPQGRTLSLDPDHQPAYRVGASVRISDEMSVRVAYTDFESGTTNAGALDPAVIGIGNSTMFPLLLHPNTQLPGNVTNIAAAGRYDIDYEAVDLDARLLVWSNRSMALNAVMGSRWTQLDQDLAVGYLVNGETRVISNCRFDGIGVRFGLDGEYRAKSGFGFYGSGVMSLMFGDARCRVSQTNTIAGPQMFTSDEYGRLVPIMEMEFGGQWVSRGGGLRVKAGYMSSQWFNIVTVRDYVNGIRSHQFDDFSDTITFDGFTTGLELAF